MEARQAQLPDGETTPSNGRYLFATAFFHGGGKAVNAWTRTDDTKFQMYYRCMVVMFASVRRVFPDAELALFTDRESLEEPYAMQLRRLGVKTRPAGHEYVGTTSFSNDFPGCLFTLDVIRELESTAYTDQTVILLDSDTVVRRSFDLPENEIVAYKLDSPLSHEMQGHSRASLTIAAAQWAGRPIDTSIDYIGGEFLSIPKSQRCALNTEIKDFWQWMEAAGGRSLGRQLTEEHVLAVVLSQPGISVTSDPSYIRRIWTADVYSDVKGDEDVASIWHLPSEKRRGFRRLHKAWNELGGFDHLTDADFDRLVRINVPALGRVERDRAGRVREGRRRLRLAVRTLITGR